MIAAVLLRPIPQPVDDSNCCAYYDFRPLATYKVNSLYFHIKSIYLLMLLKTDFSGGIMKSRTLSPIKILHSLSLTIPMVIAGLFIFANSAALAAGTSSSSV